MGLILRPVPTALLARGPFLLPSPPPLPLWQSDLPTCLSLPQKLLHPHLLREKPSPAHQHGPLLQGLPPPLPTLLVATWLPPCPPPLRTLSPLPALVGIFCSFQLTSLRHTHLLSLRAQVQRLSLSKTWVPLISPNLAFAPPNPHPSGLFPDLSPLSKLFLGLPGQRSPPTLRGAGCSPSSQSAQDGGLVPAPQGTKTSSSSQPPSQGPTAATWPAAILASSEPPQGP